MNSIYCAGAARKTGTVVVSYMRQRGVNRGTHLHDMAKFHPSRLAQCVPHENAAPFPNHMPHPTATLPRRANGYSLGTSGV